MASYRSSGDIYYLVTFFCLRSKQDVMVLSSCPAQRVCPCEHVCVCGGGVCRELVELSLRQTVPMQAVQAPEARISDAHQRNCVKAFIVIMDGQTPNWKTLDVFPSLLFLPPDNEGPSPGRMSAKQRPGLLESLASFLFYTAVINDLFIVKLYYVARDRNAESF